MGIKQRVDRLLWDNVEEVDVAFRVIGGEPGTMVDVGAHFGSSLAPFLTHGWSVHAFEPDPANRAVLAASYPSAVIDPRAISNVDGAEVELFTSDVSTGISTLSPFHPTHTPTTTVHTVRLDTYLQDRHIGQVDFLKTDIEGADLQALRTFPWHSHRPRAVVCEFEDRKTVPLGHDVHEIARFLVRHGYAVMVSEWDPIIEYGRKHRWRRFAAYPVDVPGDSWGNLIAIEPSLLHRLEQICRSDTRKVRAHRSVKRLLHRK